MFMRGVSQNGKSHIIRYEIFDCEREKERGGKEGITE